MSERKQIGSISVITDTENSYDQIGDIDGGFSNVELVKHVRQYGSAPLLEKLAFMTADVIEAARMVNSENSLAQDAVSAKTPA